MSRVKSLGDVTVKQEPHCEEHDYEIMLRVQESQVKREPESDCSDSQVKQEPEDWPEVTVKLEDPCSLYPDHEVKVEFVLGPEVLQQPVAIAPETCEENARAQQEPLRQYQKCNHSGQSLSCESCEKTNNTTHSQVPPDTCDKNISSENTLLLQGKELFTFSCDVCERKFKHYFLLKRHQRVHSGDRPLTCDISGDKPFACQICNKKFAQNSSLTIHLRAHSGEKPFECEICNKKFTQRSSLKNHQRKITHKVPSITSVSTCDKKVVNKNTLLLQQKIPLLQQQIPTAKELFPFQCDLCENKFKHYYLLKRHQRIHSGERTFTCDTSGEKGFACKICNKKFGQNSSLTVHLRTHSGEKPFICVICNKKFTQRASLTVHLRVHSGEKPFSCDVCNRKFTDSSNVIHHFRTHTGEKPFACDICNKKFKHKSSLTTHLHTHSRRPR